MKKLISTSVLLAFFFLQSFSQKDFRNGYIIMNNYDSIYGLINYGTNRENTLKCDFRANMQSQITSYYPDNIISYRFDEGKCFISKKIKPDDSTKIFLEFIFDGIVNLYDYFDQSGGHFLISQTEDEFIELKNDIRTTYVNGVPFEKESKAYIGVLKNIFRDSPAALKEADKLSLALNPLIDIAETYHHEICPSEECVTYAKGKIHLKFSLGLIAGINTSGITLIETHKILYRFVLPSNGPGIKIGAIINLMEPFFSRRLSLQSEITLGYDKYLTNISSLDIITLRMPLLQIKYSLLFNKFQISTLVGIGFNTILMFDYAIDDYGKYNYLGGRNQTGYVGGLEFSYNLKSQNRLILQLKCEYDKGTEHKGHWGDSYYFGDYNTLDMKITRIGLLLGYAF